MALVSDEHFRTTEPFNRFAQKFQCGLANAALGNEAFEHFTFMIDSTP